MFSLHKNVVANRDTSFSDLSLMANAMPKKKVCRQNRATQQGSGNASSWPDLPVVPSNQPTLSQDDSIVESRDTPFSDQGLMVKAAKKEQVSRGNRVAQQGYGMTLIRPSLPQGTSSIQILFRMTVVSRVEILHFQIQDLWQRQRRKNKCADKIMALSKVLKWHPLGLPCQQSPLTNQI